MKLIYCCRILHVAELAISGGFRRNMDWHSPVWTTARNICVSAHPLIRRLLPSHGLYVSP
jgi:hypothetical protein